MGNFKKVQKTVHLNLEGGEMKTSRASGHQWTEHKKTVGCKIFFRRKRERETWC
jgi:hypothetical protein